MIYGIKKDIGKYVKYRKKILLKYPICIHIWDIYIYTYDLYYKYMGKSTMYGILTIKVSQGIFLGLCFQKANVFWNTV